MARLSKIPDNIKPLVLEQSSKGKSASEIVEWLKLQHGVEISNSSLNKLLRSQKEERKDVAKQAYASAVAASAANDLQIVDEVIISLNKEYNKKLNKDETISANMLMKTLLQYIQFRASLAGAEEEMSKEDTQGLLEGLLEKLGK